MTFSPLVFVAAVVIAVIIIIAFNFSMIDAEEVQYNIAHHTHWYEYEEYNPDGMEFWYFHNGNFTKYATVPPIEWYGYDMFVLEAPDLEGDYYMYYEYQNTEEGDTTGKQWMRLHDEIDIAYLNHLRIEHLESELAKQIQRTVTLEQRITELQLEIVNLKN